MARTKTKKKTSKKKTSKKGGDDDLAREIDGDLDKQFDFEDGKPKKPKDLTGLTVQFMSDADEESGEPARQITAKVVVHKGKNVTVEDDVCLWETVYEDCEVVPAKGKKTKKASKERDEIDEEFGDLADDDETPKKKTSKKTSGRVPKAKTSGRVPKAEEEAEEEEEEEEDNIRPRRMLSLDKVKIPKTRVREIDKDSAKYKLIKADMKRRGQRQAIIVQTFGNAILVDGGHRYEAALELREESKGKKWTEIECQEDALVEDSSDRLLNGLLDNEARKLMHWTELAKVCAVILKGGKLKQGQLGKLIGKKEGQMSRLLATLGLPKTLRALAVEGGGKKGGVAYAEGVFEELTTVSKEVQSEAAKAMGSGRPFTMADVRALKAEEKAKEKKAAKDGESDGESTPTPSSGGGSGYTYQSLTKAERGEYIGIVVHREHAVLTFHIDNSSKTFRDFDPIDEIKGLFEALFEDEDFTISSFKGLAKAMKDARTELTD